jgi:general secretion pathway protein I
MKRSATSLGFTLLEVMVSLSILALALTAAAGVNLGSFASSEYARNVTVATLLARSKMIDIEEELRQEGFSDQDRELDGDFEDEEQPSFRWRALIRRVDVDMFELISGLLGGETDSESLPDSVQSLLSAKDGIDTKAGKTPVEGDQLAGLLGGEQTVNFIKQIGDTFSDGIREIQLEVEWGPKDNKPESIQFVQYVTTNGRLSRANPRPPTPGATNPPTGGTPTPGTGTRTTGP